MATELIFPKLGFSMNEGALTEWLVADGARVTEDQVFYALENDKSPHEVEYPAIGAVGKETNMRVVER